jgi:hypothetical protein
MPAESVDPGVDEGRQEPAVESDPHGDPGEEREDELDPAHRVAMGSTTRMLPAGGSGSRSGSDQRAVMPSRVAAAALCF